MISASLGSSRKFHALPGISGKLGEFAQALFPLIISHSDDFGRLEGDAFTIKHKVFPTSPRSEADFNKALEAMDTVGLIQLYTIEGVTFLSVVNFDDHQNGLHKRTASKFPEPPGNSRKFPEIPSEEKRTEEKRTEHELKRREGAPRYAQSVEEILCELEAEPAYKGIDVRREYEKAAVWCKANNRQHTKKFFVNWLNRADRSIGGNGKANDQRIVGNAAPKPGKYDHLSKSG